MASQNAGGDRFRDVIVAVHGIGQQMRYSTVRSVTTRFATSTRFGDYTTKPAANQPAVYPPAVAQPLGYFHSGDAALASVVRVDEVDSLKKGSELRGVGFAEVYWANIPHRVKSEGFTLEETKAWGRTVVSRAQSIWNRWNSGDTGLPADSEKKASADKKVPVDFSLASEVLDEVIETVYVLENIVFLANKAGLFKFDLKEVLEDYLGDVQVVAEFANYRNEIVSQFQEQMRRIYEQERYSGNSGVRLHVVAHSEGTVVSFLGLLEAMSGNQMVTSSSESGPRFTVEHKGVPEWLRHVHGYMTIGSPIDKHLLLWPAMWKHLEPGRANGPLAEGQIKWRNYYDFGDPIGFKLDTARDWLAAWGSNVFEFKAKHDHGFSRYMLPGKAHNDYWNDPEVFDHFMHEAGICQTPAPKPKHSHGIGVFSTALPYVVSFFLLAAGVYLLNKNVLDVIYPLQDSIVRNALATQIGLDPTKAMSRWELVCTTVGIAALLAGATLFARLPRLAAGAFWKVAGLVAFAIGCAIYTAIVPETQLKDIGLVFQFLTPDTWHGPATGICALALLIGFIGLFGTTGSKRRDNDRRQHWIAQGMRPLILGGAVVSMFVVATQVFPERFPERLGLTVKLTDQDKDALAKAESRAMQEDKTLKAGDFVAIVSDANLDRAELDQLVANEAKLPNLPKVRGILTERPPLWPLLLAGALFVYLWWLAALLFDLAFVWHRYIRLSVGVKRLRDWAPKPEVQLAERNRANPAG